MKETGGPAFPVGDPEMTIEGQTIKETQGMTLRDYTVLHGPWTIKDIWTFHKGEDLDPQRLSELVVKWNNIYADYFIKERNK